MILTVLTPDKEIYKGEVTSVKVPGTNGQFEILNNHAAIVAALGEGDVRMITDSGETRSFSIQKGFVEVLKNEVSLLVQGIQEN